jgi:hypothetical protein
MALNKQLVELRFNKGVDTGTDPKCVIPSKFTTMDNVELNQTDTFLQRPGYTAITISPHTGSPAVAGIRALHTLDEELLIEAGSGMHSAIRERTVSRNGLTGAALHKTFERAQVKYETLNSVGARTALDCAVASPSGFECYVWREGNLGIGDNLRYVIFDEVSRAEVQSGIVFTNTAGFLATNIRVVVRNSGGGSKFYIYYSVYTGALTSIRMKSITVAA